MDNNSLLEISDNLKNETIFWEPLLINKDSAWTSHVPFAHWITAICQPDIFVELGTHTGVSYAAFCNAVNKLGLKTKCYAVDTWEGDSQAGFYEQSVYNDINQFNEANFSSFSKLIKSTFDDACINFENGSIDLLHIDGFHTYEAVKHDFDNWLPKLSNKAVVLFHDTNEKGRDFGVWKFWEELTQQYKNNFHFLHGHGLGVLFVGQELSAELKAFFNQDEAHASFTKNIFKVTGERWEAEQVFKSKEEDYQKNADNKIVSWQQEEQKIKEEIKKSFDKERTEFRSEISSKNNEISSLYNNIWLVNTQVQSFELDSLWRYMRKHPGFKRFLTKYIGYLRAALKGKLKKERRRYRQAKKHVKVIQNSPLFDAEWYSKKYFDVVYSGFKPAMHYALYGKDGRLPSPWFHAQMYQQQYGDVANSDFTPLAHYELHGRAEERYFQDCENIDAAHVRKDIAAKFSLVMDENRLYENWQEIIEKPHIESLLEKITEQETEKKIGSNPLFSVIIPTYNTPKRLLEKCINSVCNQTFTDWELCIADDSSTSRSTIATLKSFEQKDKRIKVVFRKENGHISEASNSALQIATGEYIVLLDHDDELVPVALQEVAMSIHQNPNAKIIYSDEDKLDKHGKRIHPYFKPDFSPDLLFSQNYICHLSIYKKSIIDKIGGFRKGFEGSQDYDLVLRAYREVGDISQIVHIPRVLYHWRMTDSSTASTHENKPYAAAAGLRALQDFFDNNYPGVQVETMLDGRYKTNWPIPMEAPLVSLIIGTRDSYEDLKKCIDSIHIKTSYKNYEIIIVDNQTTDLATLAYFDSLKTSSNIKIISYDKEFNYSAINNLGVTHANGSIIGLINNDIEIVNEEWLGEMVSLAVRKDIGCVGAKLLYPDNSIQHAGVVLGLGGIAGHPHKFIGGDSEGYFRLLKIVHNVSAVTGAALLVRKEIFEKVGGLDEKGLSVAFNDVDFCIKVQQAGFRNIWTPFAVLRHYESKSRGLDNTPTKYERFMSEINVMNSRWGDLLKRDPYYNPNLSLEKEGYTIRIS